MVLGNIAGNVDRAGGIQYNFLFGNIDTAAIESSRIAGDVTGQKGRIDLCQIYTTAVFGRVVLDVGVFTVQGKHTAGQIYTTAIGSGVVCNGTCVGYGHITSGNVNTTAIDSGIICIFIHTDRSAGQGKTAVQYSGAATVGRLVAEQTDLLIGNRHIAVVQTHATTITGGDVFFEHHSAGRGVYRKACRSRWVTENVHACSVNSFIANKVHIACRSQRDDLLINEDTAAVTGSNVVGKRAVVQVRGTAGQVNACAVDSGIFADNCIPAVQGQRTAGQVNTAAFIGGIIRKNITAGHGEVTAGEIDSTAVSGFTIGDGAAGHIHFTVGDIHCTAATVYAVDKCAFAWYGSVAVADGTACHGYVAASNVNGAAECISVLSKAVFDRAAGDGNITTLQIDSAACGGNTIRDSTVAQCNAAAAQIHRTAIIGCRAIFNNAAGEDKSTVRHKYCAAVVRGTVADGTAGNFRYASVVIHVNGTAVGLDEVIICAVGVVDKAAGHGERAGGCTFSHNDLSLNCAAGNSYFGVSQSALFIVTYAAADRTGFQSAAVYSQFCITAASGTG